MYSNTRLAYAASPCAKSSTGNFAAYLESWETLDLEARTVAYQGCHGEKYIEAYPAVTIA